VSSTTLTAVPDADFDGALEDWGPRLGADVGAPVTSGRVFYEADGVQVGVWECTPGGWAIENRPDTETVRILAGRARITDAGGASVELTAGDALVLPKGWSGRWDVLETVRKHFVVVQ
jgi:uncharacterized cupin superfamily protein